MRRSTEADPEDRDVVVPPEDLIIAAAGYGRWQILVTIFLCVTIMSHVMDSSLEPIHHMGGWWCEKPETFRSWTNSEWIIFSHVNATPRGFPQELLTERFKGCYIYDYDFSHLRNIDFESRPEIGARKIVRCKKVHYSRKFGRSVAEKFDKGCDPKFERSFWHVSAMLGEFFGYVIFGYLSDRLGRKPVLTLACGTTPITSIFLAISPTYATHIIARSLHGFFHGAFVVSFVMLIEITNNVYRTRITALGVISHALGVGLTPIIFQSVSSIDKLLLMINLPHALLLISMILIPESPSWLFCERKSTHLKNTIRASARINGVPLPDDFRVIYVDFTDAEKELPKKKPGCLKLLRAPELACEIFAVGYLISLSAVIYGSAKAKLIYNEKRVDRWYSIIGLDEMIGFAISQFCVLLMGHRKLLHVAVFLILVTTGVLMVNLREDYVTTTGPATTVLAANVFAVCLTYGAVLNYNVRTVPTLLRGSYLGVWFSLWTLFTWLGTHGHINYPGISSTALITLLLAALATFNIRDLLWRELPDSLNDAVNFKDKPKPKRWMLSETHLIAGGH